MIIITAFDDLRSREAERLECVACLRTPCEAEAILALLRRLADDERSSNT